MKAEEKSKFWKDVAHRQAARLYLYKKDLAYLRGFRNGRNSVIDNIEVQ